MKELNLFINNKKLDSIESRLITLKYKDRYELIRLYKNKKVDLMHEIGVE